MTISRVPIEGCDDVVSKSGKKPIAKNSVVSWCSWLSRQSNTLKVSGSSPGDANLTPEPTPAIVTCPSSLAHRRLPFVACPSSLALRRSLSSAFRRSYSDHSINFERLI
ncbi:hypothetical protein E6C27_scaffold43059G001110 [Cucumis melo var. makuwa]|uniref:Uncharacterized protein n=1 Tax=Cucumis melo var. makuwa TaxID=1194695 RepID=A0A5A7SSI4_CUCMM|nr:hypothetical protein E6C27_scaffold43059G001110 [Cucumis melo var. makuwa]